MAMVSWFCATNYEIRDSDSGEGDTEYKEMVSKANYQASEYNHWRRENSRQCDDQDAEFSVSTVLRGCAH